MCVFMNILFKVSCYVDIDVLPGFLCTLCKQMISFTFEGIIRIFTCDDINGVSTPTGKKEEKPGIL